MLARMLLFTIQSCAALSPCVLHGPGRPVSYLSAVLKAYPIPVRVIDTANVSLPELPPNDLISSEVRRAGLHVLYALTECGGDPWTMLVEDDMVPCKGAIDTVRTVLANTSYDVVFFSKFSRAFAMRRERVELFATSVRENLELKPYDIVLRTGMWLPPGEHMLTYPKNLFHHIGSLSTVPERNSKDFIQKHAALRGDICGEVMT